MQTQEKKSEIDKSEKPANNDITAAEKTAELDIEMDPELSMEPEPGDDLDEGELARFESED